MGDEVKKAVTYSPLKELVVDPIREPVKMAKQQRREQSAEIRRQRMMEEARLAEEEDEINRRRLRTQTGGRSLLIQTNPLGSTADLGGGGMYG